VPYHLLTVDHSHPTGFGLQVAPTVRLRRLVDDSPGTMKPMPGDPIELRLPDGQVQAAVIGQFGIDGWKGGDGHFYTASDPADPQLTLAIRDAGPGDVPAGTEIWLPGREGGASAAETGPCSYCQRMQARARRSKLPGQGDG